MCNVTVFPEQTSHPMLFVPVFLSSSPNTTPFIIVVILINSKNLMPQTFCFVKEKNFFVHGYFFPFDV